MKADELAARSGPIRIEKAEAFRVSVSMREPFRISSGEVSQKEAILVRLEDGTAFGWGESSAMGVGFYSADTPDGCQSEILNLLLPGILGRGFENLLALEAWLLEQRVSPFSRVAVETAVCELLARRAGVSLRDWFGIASRPVASGLAVGLYDSLDELRAALNRYRPRDYARLKIKIKRGQDVSLVLAVRKWLGHGFPLWVDANADYSLRDLNIFLALEVFGLLMFEQPFARGDFEGMAALQRSVQTPVCIDETAESLADVRRALDHGCCRIVNIKLQRIGGFLEALRIVEECERRGVPVWMGTMPELGVGSAQALALAAHPAFSFPTDVEPSARWYEHDLLTPRLDLRYGALDAPTGPGLGFEVDPELLEHSTVAHWELRA